MNLPFVTLPKKSYVSLYLNRFVSTCNSHRAFYCFRTSTTCPMISILGKGSQRCFVPTLYSTHATQLVHKVFQTTLAPNDVNKIPPKESQRFVAHNLLTYITAISLPASMLLHKSIFWTGCLIYCTKHFPMCECTLILQDSSMREGHCRGYRKIRESFWLAGI